MEIFKDIVVTIKDQMMRVKFETVKKFKINQIKLINFIILLFTKVSSIYP